MSRPRVKITLIDRKGPVGCHRGHQVGDSWDFDTQRGEICPMAMHVAFCTSTSCATAAASRAKTLVRQLSAAPTPTR